MLALVEVSDKLAFLGVDVKWFGMNEYEGIVNDGILMGSLVISEFGEKVSILAFNSFSRNAFDFGKWVNLMDE